MSEPALKCENNAIFKQNYVQKLFYFSNILILLFALEGQSTISRFSPKNYYSINYWSHLLIFETFFLLCSARQFGHLMKAFFLQKNHYNAATQIVVTTKIVRQS